jgi:hypothetical protein
MSPLPGGFDVDPRLLGSAKALLALAGLALLLWDLRLASRPPAWWPRFRTGALALVGVLSLAAWWNFGALHGRGRPLHLHDFFHYYIGSKYYAELGYTRIYRCAAVAEMQRGRARQIAGRWTRNLDTNDLEQTVPSRSEVQDCLSRFGPERWNEFAADVEWFRRHMHEEAWNGVAMVFGHNATPAWNAMGNWLTRRGPASDRQLLALAALDPLLLAIMWLLVWRTFGWQAGSVAAIWWGLNEATGFYWVGGGFLRQDALFCIVGGVCAMRAGRTGLAGAAMATAALLRAFPVFLLGGLAVKFLADVRTRGPQGSLAGYRRFAGGFALATVLLLTFSGLTWSGPWGGPLEPWKAFASNSRKHLETPISNHVGLKPALWFSPETRAAALEAFWVDGPWDSWRAAHTATAERRMPLYLVVTAVFVVLFWRAVRSAADWIALISGVALLPFATTLANYYYSVLLVFGLLWPLDKPTGAGLAALSALTAVLPGFLDRRDDRYALVSVAVVLYAFFVVIRLGRGRRMTLPAAPATLARRSDDRQAV